MLISKKVAPYFQIFFLNIFFLFYFIAFAFILLIKYYTYFIHEILSFGFGITGIIRGFHVTREENLIVNFFKKNKKKKF